MGGLSVLVPCQRCSVAAGRLLAERGAGWNCGDLRARWSAQPASHLAGSEGEQSRKSQADKQQRRRLGDLLDCQEIGPVGVLEVTTLLHPDVIETLLVGGSYVSQGQDTAIPRSLGGGQPRTAGQVRLVFQVISEAADGHHLHAQAAA